MSATKIENCLPLILAGGESRRMGRNKADSEWEGTTLLARMIEIVTPHFPQTIVSLRIERPELATRQSIDHSSGRGPIIGVYSALIHIETDWLFAIGVDMPFMTGAMIRFLASCRTTTGAAVAPIVDNHPQPLGALYHRSLAPALKKAIDRGERSLTKALYSSDTTFVGEERLRSVDPTLRSFVDIDTPEELCEGEEKRVR